VTPATAFDAIVIGAGANGLTAAATLGGAGRRVLVLERAGTSGARARASEIAAGFRAPLTTDAGWLPPAVAKELGLSAPPLVVPETSITVSDGNGGLFSLPRDPSRAAEAIRGRSQRDALRWPGFAEQIGKLANFLGALYQLPAPQIDSRSVGELIPLAGLGRKFRSLGRRDMIELLRVLPMPVQDLLDDTFENAALKAAIGAGGVRELRQGPRSGGTSFVLLHYLVGAPAGSVRERAWWSDGPNGFSAAAEAVATQRGVTVRSNADVAHITVRDDAVTGVVLAGGEEIAAPVVISTADPRRTLLGLVDPVWLDPEFLHAVKNIKFRGSTAIVHFAVDRLPDASGLSTGGMVSLTSSLDAMERAADAAKYGTVADEPHVEIVAPSARWPSLAPPGKHVLSATVRYAPYRLRDDTTWDSTRATALADKVTSAVSRVIPGFADTIVDRQVLTPVDIESRFAVTEGALTHGELTLDQILFMRPVPGYGRHAMPIDGLYLGGAGTHPGPGILGGSGWLAAKQVLKRR